MDGLLKIWWSHDCEVRGHGIQTTIEFDSKDCSVKVVTRSVTEDCCGEPARFYEVWDKLIKDFEEAVEDDRSNFKEEVLKLINSMFSKLRPLRCLQ